MMVRKCLLKKRMHPPQNSNSSVGSDLQRPPSPERFRANQKLQHVTEGTLTGTGHWPSHREACSSAWPPFQHRDFPNVLSGAALCHSCTSCQCFQEQSTKLHTVLKMWLHLHQTQQDNHLWWQKAVLSSMQTKMQLALLVARARCWTTVRLMATQPSECCLLLPA